MLQKFISAVGGNPHKREIEKLSEIVNQINALEPEFEKLSDEALRAKTEEFRAKLTPLSSPPVGGKDGGLEKMGGEGGGREGDNEKIQDILEEILPEAFAAVREASKRTIGLRHYDVQLSGGIVLHRGGIAEMKTGEGKTLVATMPLYLNALIGRGAHLVTVNDYLARRDSEWMGPIYTFLGLTVGCIQNGMDSATRREHYGCDITYGTNNEFGFDYLRDNMAVRPEHRVQRGFVYAIVDEVDSVLVDEARTPLIISGPVEHSDQGFDDLKPLVEH